LGCEYSRSLALDPTPKSGTNQLLIVLDCRKSSQCQKSFDQPGLSYREISLKGSIPLSSIHLFRHELEHPMNTPLMDTDKPPQILSPLSLIAQLNSRKANGCLQVMSNNITWSLYLEQGKILYAANTVTPFERLDRHLHCLNRQIPTLVSAVREQMRLLFESKPERSPHSREYEAICWLVEQQHLTAEQAALLIEELAKEVLDSLLREQTGSDELIEQDLIEQDLIGQELIEQDLLSEFPKFCHLDPHLLIEHCQLRRQQPAASPCPLDAPPMSSPVVPPDPSSKTTYTIACIDDNLTVLQAIHSFLDDKSFSVVSISDPIKALMQVIRSKPDLILLDATMPQPDGYGLCLMLRNHPNFRQTPIVILADNLSFVDCAKAKLVGASSYLAKPFTQPDLIKAVCKHLT
jgi:two-component system, chemotaxis family, response regulator PixG